MERIKNLEKIVPHVRKLVEPYLRDLLRVAGDDIISIVLFGSATGPDYVPGRSNINLAVLVRTADPAFLKKCLAHSARGLRKRIMAPLFLTQEYIDNSRDVFPVEFLDIRETCLVLVGSDPFANVDLSNSSLRLECEQQLKGTGLRTRQAYLEIGLTRRGIERVMTGSLNSLIPVFRAMLVLKGVRPPRSKQDIIDSVCSTFGIASGVFLQVLGLKLGTKRVPPETQERILPDYITSVEALARLVDAL